MPMNAVSNSHNYSLEIYREVPEISEHNPRALFGKSLPYDIDFLNSAPEVVLTNLRYGQECYVLLALGFIEWYG